MNLLTYLPYVLAGFVGGILGFWAMFALAHWLFPTPRERKRKPREVGPRGYGTWSGL